MALRSGWGQQYGPPSGGAFSSATTVASTQISGLSSRQVVFGSSVGGIAQASFFQVDSTQGFVGIGTTAPAGPLQVNSGTTAVLTVTTANRVGIGTTAPASPLTVRPAADQVFRVQGASLQGTGALIVVANDAAATIQGLELSASTFIFTGQNGNGSVGIGSTAPAARLDVQGSSNAEVVRLSGMSSAGTTLGPAFVVKSTGTTQAIAFWSTAGTTRPAAYTVNAVTTNRTLPTTQSTVTAGSVSTAQYVALVNAFNDLLGYVKTETQDWAAYGLLTTA